MLALKKKREAEKLAAEATAAATPSPSASDAPSAPPAASTKVSLLGIGGRKTGTNGIAAKNGDSGTAKKRTPGEIRIQKGTTTTN